MGFWQTKKFRFGGRRRSWATAGWATLLIAGACGNSPATVNDVSATSATVPDPTASGTSSMVNGVAKLKLTGCAAFDYLAQVEVGGETLNLLLDSGSTTMAVAGSSCTDCGTDKTYKPSSTSQSLGRKASSQYLDNSEWVGSIYRDSVALGANQAAATPAVKVDFVVISEQNQFFTSDVSCQSEDDVSFDGIIGVGPDDMLQAYTTSFLSTMTSTGSTKEDLFAVQTCDIGGTMWLGGYDANAMTASPNFTPLISTSSPANTSGAYAVNVTGVGLGTTSFDLAASDMGPMVIDTGTNSMLLLANAWTAFEQSLEANTAYLNNFGTGFISAQTGQCAAASQGLTRAQIDAELPPLNFTFARADGSMFEVSLPATSSYLVAGTISGDSTGSVYYCPSIATSTVAIFGNVAMRSLVTIFDRANQQVGFAPQTGCQPQTVIYFNGT